MFELIFYVVVPLLVLIVGAITGTIQERRHLASLDEREPTVADIAVTDLRGTPPGMIAVSGELVMGQVVLGSDRGKQVVAQLRSLIGGEVRSFQTILVRAGSVRIASSTSASRRPRSRTWPPRSSATARLSGRPGKRYPP